MFFGPKRYSICNIMAGLTLAEGKRDSIRLKHPTFFGEIKKCFDLRSHVMCFVIIEDLLA